MLQPVVECVQEVDTGRWVAYFGYNNDATAALTIAQGQAQNILRDGLKELALQPKTFTRGRVFGVLAVESSLENPVTWTLHEPNRKTASTTADKNSPRCRPVSPVLSCAGNEPAASGTSTLVQSFGYLNENKFPIVLPLGKSNRFSDQIDRGQPTIFLPGRVDSVIAIKTASDASGVPRWTLGEKTLSFVEGDNTPRCINNCSLQSRSEILNKVSAALMRTIQEHITAVKLLEDFIRQQCQGKASCPAMTLAQGAKQRALGNVEKLKTLLSRLPENFVSCAELICAATDHFAVLTELQQIITKVEHHTRRVIARKLFLETGSTQAHASRELSIRGNVQKYAADSRQALQEIPRFSEACY